MSGWHSLRILLVDDGRGSAEELGRTIRALGYECSVADRTAIATTRQVASADVVVLSLDLCAADATAMGRGLCEQSGLRTPLVVGLADPEDPAANHRASDIGAHLVLMKPINVAVLAGALRRFREFLTGVEACDPAINERKGAP